MFGRLRGLIKPSRFDGDPYGGLLNQWGNYSAAAGLFLMLCGGFFMAFGEMPFRLHIALAVVVAYILVVEWVLQGWQGWDTVEDSTFVALGVSTVALSVREHGVSGNVAFVAVDVPILMLHLVGAVAAVLAYAYRRRGI